MKKSKQAKVSAIHMVFVLMAEEGESVRAACVKAGIDRTTFYEELAEDVGLADQYARAREDRADFIFEDILKIADDTTGDSSYTDKGETENKEWVNRSKLKVAARQWVLARMSPKKYGAKTDITTGGEKVTINLNLGAEEDIE